MQERLTGLRGRLARLVERRERWGVWLFAATLLTLFGLALSNVLLGLTLLVLPWTAPWRRVPWRQVRGLMLALGAFVAFLLTSIAASYDPRQSLGALSGLLALSVLPLAVILLRGEREVRRLVDLLIGFAALVAVHGLGQFLAGYGSIDLRIRGPFSHYMTFAGVLLIGDLLLIGRLLAGPAPDPAAAQPWRLLAARPMQLLMLTLVNLALLGSLTRGAWVAVAVAATLLLALRAPRLLVAYLPAAVLFVLLAPIPMLWRAMSIADLEDPSNYDRICMIQAGVHMVAEKPLFGIGPNLVKRRYPIYRHPTAPRLNVPHLHNSFLQIAAERGLTSLAAYLALQGLALAAAWRGYRASRGDRHGPADLHLGVVSALIAFNVAGLFEHNWGDAEVQRLALVLLALPFCLMNGDGTEPVAGAHRPAGAGAASVAPGRDVEAREPVGA